MTVHALPAATKTAPSPFGPLPPWSRPIDLGFDDDDDLDEVLLEEEDPSNYPTRLVVPALGRPQPETRAPRSIFDVSEPLWLARNVSLSAATSAAHQTQVARAEGVTRCVGSRYPDNRWTPERQEQENARRARQVVPRPPKQRFKTKGSKDWATPNV